MAAKRKKASGNARKGRKQFSLHFGWSGLFSAFLLALIVLVWAFILGVLVGRGYQPESFWPALSGILPQQQEAHENNEEMPQIMDAEELEFMESLTGQESSQEYPRREIFSDEEGEEIPDPESAQLPDEEIVYHFQVAALQSRERAQEVVRNLQLEGLKADSRTVERDGVTWHRVVVRFTARPGQEERIKRKLEDYGAGEPFLREKARLD